MFQDLRLWDDNRLLKILPEFSDRHDFLSLVSDCGAQLDPKSTTYYLSEVCVPKDHLDFLMFNDLLRLQVWNLGNLALVWQLWDLDRFLLDLQRWNIITDAALRRTAMQNWSNSSVESVSCPTKDNAATSQTCPKRQQHHWTDVASPLKLRNLVEPTVVPPWLRPPSQRVMT